MEEPRVSIPLDYRFLHLSFHRYKRKRKGDTKAETVGSTEKRHPVLNGIKILSRDPRESIGKSVLLFPFFLCFFLVCIL